MDEPFRASPATASVVVTSARAFATSATQASRSDLRASLIGAAFLLFGFGGQAVRNLVDWPGFILASLIMLVIAVKVLIEYRPTLRVVPPALLVFMVICASSVLWSEYRWVTVFGTAAQWATALAGVLLAVSLDRVRFMRVFELSMVAILGGSLLFEVFVTVFIGHRFAPFTVERRPDLPGAFYWSENHLLEGGPIQGLVGNRNLLAFIALLAVVAIVVGMLHRKRIGKLDMTALALAGITMALTRSATVIVALFVVGLVGGVIMAFRRIPPQYRKLSFGALVAAGFLGLLVVLQHSSTVLGLLGRSDLTNRVDVWRKVFHIAEQNPILGIGWTSYWAPWAKPFHNLVVIDGVQYLQAHNALLDVWLQVGIVGALAAVALVVWTVWRAIQAAVHAETKDVAIAVAPLLLLTALLAQSLTESRLLLEGNWMLFVALSVQLWMAGPVVKRAFASRSVTAHPVESSAP